MREFAKRNRQRKECRKGEGGCEVGRLVEFTEDRVSLEANVAIQVNVP